MNNFYKKKIGIFGLGLTGVAAIKFFIKNRASIFIWDDNSYRLNVVKKKFSYSHIINNIKEDIKYFDFVVISPGIPKLYPKEHKIFSLCKLYNIDVLSDIDILVKIQNNSIFSAITGTNGKSTTVSLLNYLCVPSIIVGNIGIAALSKKVFNFRGMYIVEISSFQIEILKDTTIFDHIAILDIFPDHQDRYIDFYKYKKTKKLLCYHAKKSIIISVDQNSDIYYSLLHDIKIKAQIIPIASKSKIEFGISCINCVIYDNFFAKNIVKLEIPDSLKGMHNANNIATCYALCLSNRKKFLPSLINSFKGLKYRMEVINSNNKRIIVINDSKATNMTATIIALNSFKTIHWLAGGILKKQNIFFLINQMLNVKCCYFFGRDKNIFINFAKQLKIKYYSCINLKEAVRVVKRKCKYGTVLLSPACSSYDQWKNFEERGLYFKKYIQSKVL